MAWVGQNQPSGVRRAPGAAVLASDDATRTFFQRVYLYMGLGLGVTGLVALLIASSPAALQLIFGNRMVFYILLFAQLGLVLGFSALVNRVSAATAGLMFFSYAALSGVTFASIFMVYTASSIASTFFVTAGMFAGLSFYGVVTKRSLDSVGSFATMGLLGLVIASLVNIFLGSSLLYWLTTFVGVIVFTALTAYDTARLKAVAAEAVASGGDTLSKAALRGALTLYLDFINLFLMLLRLFGGRRRD